MDAYGLAVQGLKAIRKTGYTNLQSHIRHFGPLPAPSSSRTSVVPNPFVPRFNPKTKRWAPPRYSLRRQADLIKHIKAAEQQLQLPLTSLLPPGPKFVPSKIEKDGIAGLLPRESWTKPVEWHGAFNEKEKPIAGLYANRKRMFKGHKWERVKAARDAKKKVLMRDMAKRVRSYKAYYHKRKPNPLKPSRKAKAARLPF